MNETFVLIFWWRHLQPVLVTEDHLRGFVSSLRLLLLPHWLFHFPWRARGQLESAQWVLLLLFPWRVVCLLTYKPHHSAWRVNCFSRVFICEEHSVYWFGGNPITFDLIALKWMMELQATALPWGMMGRWHCAAVISQEENFRNIPWK